MRHPSAARSSDNLLATAAAAAAAAAPEGEAGMDAQRQCSSEPASPRGGRPPEDAPESGPATAPAPTEAELSHFNEWSALLDMDAPAGKPTPCAPRLWRHWMTNWWPENSVKQASWGCPLCVQVSRECQ